MPMIYEAAGTTSKYMDNIPNNPISIIFPKLEQHMWLVCDLAKGH